MIYAVCGSPGSYKSCYALEKFIIPALAEGKQVYTNIEGLSSVYIATYFDMDPVRVDSCLHQLGQVWDDDGTWHEDREKIRRFYEDLPVNSLVVIDEAQNYFSSRDFKEGFSADLIPFLTKHRHLGINIVWITQNIDSVDITFRRNTHMTYALKRLENLGLKGSSFVYCFDRADLERKHLNRFRYAPNPLVFRCYSSYVAEDVKEERKSYNIILRSPFLWLFLIALGFAVFQVLGGGLDRVIGRKKPEVKKVEKVKEQKVVEQKQGGENVEITKDGRCIARVAKVRGVATYYLDDGTTTLDGFGLGRCPGK